METLCVPCHLQETLRQNEARRAQKHKLEGTEPRPKKKKKGDRDRNMPTCGYCNERGHNQRNCAAKKRDEEAQECLTRITMRSDEMKRPPAP